MEACISCGKPLGNEDIVGDLKRNYCIYCRRTDGEMKSFEEKWDEYLKKVKLLTGYSDKFSKKLVFGILKKQPAWKASIKKMEEE